VWLWVGVVKRVYAHRSVYAGVGVFLTGCVRTRCLCLGVCLYAAHTGTLYAGVHAMAGSSCGGWGGHGRNCSCVCLLVNGRGLCSCVGLRYQGSSWSQK
jgi:hypothetical protein